MANGVENGAGPAIEEVRRLLKLWAQWLQWGDGGGGCRGYPSSVAFIHAGQSRDSGNVVRIDNEEANQVERAMCQLKLINHRIFQALIFEYVTGDTNKEAARRLKVSEPTFRAWRAYGEYFIAGKILP